MKRSRNRMSPKFVVPLARPPVFTIFPTSPKYPDFKERRSIVPLKAIRRIQIQNRFECLGCDGLPVARQGSPGCRTCALEIRLIAGDLDLSQVFEPPRRQFVASPCAFRSRSE